MLAETARQTASIPTMETSIRHRSWKEGFVDHGNNLGGKRTARAFKDSSHGTENSHKECNQLEAIAFLRKTQEVKMCEF